MTGPDPRSLDLPSAFLEINGEDRAWLAALPSLLDQLAARWSLAVEPYFPGIRFNYVAPATRADGTRAVLKVSRYIEDTRSETAALRLYDGDGIARLLEAAPEIGALLVERLEPGTMLLEVAESDDAAATLIAAGMLRHLWRPAPPAHEMFTLERWCAAFDRNRAALSQGARGFPADVFLRADAMRAELLASTETQTVLHGDMHHFNVLRAQRANWLAIDPKGIVGDRHFDVCMFFRNPVPHGVPAAVNRRRLDIFCTELGLDRARTKDWCFVHAVLDACWDYEDGRPWQRKIAYAEETQSF